MQHGIILAVAATINLSLPPPLPLDCVTHLNLQIGVGYQHKTVVRQRTVEQPAAGERVVDMSVAGAGRSKGKRRHRQRKKSGRGSDGDSSSSGSSDSSSSDDDDEGGGERKRNRRKKKNSKSSSAKSKSKKRKKHKDKSEERDGKSAKKVRQEFHRCTSHTYYSSIINDGCFLTFWKISFSIVLNSA